MIDKVEIVRMCGGPYRRGKPIRRVEGGVILDWIGIGIWVRRIDRSEKFPPMPPPF